MKYINKWFIIIWIAIILVSSILTLHCSAGAYIDAEEMMELCGVSPEQYFEIQETDGSFCPEGEQAIKSAGACLPDITIIILLSIIYNIIYLIIYLVFKKSK